MSARLLPHLVTGRPGWRLAGDTEATYARPGTDWTGRVRQLAIASSTTLRPWHAALLRTDGTAERCCRLHNEVEAIAWIESWR